MPDPQPPVQTPVTQEPFPGFNELRQRLQERADDLDNRSELLRQQQAGTVAIPERTPRGGGLGFIDTARVTAASGIRSLSVGKASLFGVDVPIVPTAPGLVLRDPDPAVFASTVKIKTPEDILASIGQATELQNSAVEFTRDTANLSWRITVLNALPAMVIGDQDNPPVRTMSDVMRVFVNGPEGTPLESAQWVTRDDIAFAAEVLDRSIRSAEQKNIQPLTDERRRAIVQQISRTRSASAYGILMGSGGNLLDQLIDLAQPRLPTGVASAADLREIVESAGYENDEIAEIQQAMRSEISAVMQGFYREQALYARLMSDLASMELDDLKKLLTEKAIQGLVSRPLVPLMLPVDYWRRNVAQPIAGALTLLGASMNVQSVDRGLMAFNPLVRLLSIPTEDAEEFRDLFHQAQQDQNSWRALQFAFENSNMNGFQKFMLEVVGDPITYFGFGVYAKVLRALPRGYGVPLAGIEEGFVRGVDLVFLNIKQGLYNAAPKTIGQLVKAETRAAFNNIQAYVAADSLSKNPVTRRFAQIPLPDIKDSLRRAVSVAKRNPGDGTDMVAVGRTLLARAPATEADINKLANTLGQVAPLPEDFTKGFKLLDVNNALGYTIGSEGRVLTADESATQIMRIMGVMDGPDQVRFRAVRNWIEERISASAQTADEIINQPETVKELHKRIFSHIDEVARQEFNPRVRGHSTRLGALGANWVHLEAISKLTYANTVDRINRGFARLYLLFAFYSPFNVLENGMKTAYAGLNPIFRGDMVREVQSYTTGLRGLSPVLESGVGVTLDLGPMESTIRAAQGRLAGVSRKTFRRHAKARRSGWTSWHTWLDDKVVKSGGRMGLQQQANFVFRSMQRWYHQNHPELMTRLGGIIEHSASTLRSGGVSDDIIRQVMSEAENRAVTNPSSLTQLGRDFTPGHVHASQINKLIQKYPDIGPVGINYLSQKNNTAELLPQLSRIMQDEIPELIRQEVMHSPELAQMQLTKLLDEIVLHPPQTLDDLRLRVQTLQFIGSDVSSVISAQTRATQAYAREIMNLELKGEIYREMWDEILLPFMQGAEERIERYITHLKNAMADPGQLTGLTVSLPDTVSTRGGFRKLPAVYVRFGELPSGGAPSFNAFTGRAEEGVSVFKAWKDPRTGKYVIQSPGEGVATQQELIASDLPLFEVEGQVLRVSGGDLEDLLRPGTARITREIPRSQAVTDDAPNILLTGDELPESAVPDWMAADVAQGIGLTPEQSIQFTRLLDENLKRVALIRETWQRHRNLTREMFATRDAIRAEVRAAGGKPNVDHARIRGWWERFHQAREDFWTTARESISKADAEILSLGSGLDGEALPQPASILGRRLVTADVSRLFNSVPADLTRNLFVPELGVLQDPVQWVEKVYAQAQKVAAQAGQTADDTGFTREAIRAVYDDILKEMTGSAEVRELIHPRLMQVEALRRELMSFATRKNSLMTAEHQAALERFGTQAFESIQADDVARQLITEIQASPQALVNTGDTVVIGNRNVTAELVRDIEQPRYLTEIDRDKYIMLDVPGRGKWFVSMDEVENGVDVSILPFADEAGELTPLEDTLTTPAESVLNASELRDFARQIAQLFPDAEFVEGFRETVGHARVTQRMSLSRFRGEGRAAASWQAERQKALDAANDELHLNFPDYDSATALNAMGRSAFPFWTYETHRLFWLPRTWIRTPGTLATQGKYQDYTDQGYMALPGTSWQINPLRGTIWMGGMRRLLMRDFPEYYDRFPELANGFDWLSRFGFYPNIAITFGFAATGAKVSNAIQLGEVLPQVVQTPLEAYVAMHPDSTVAKWLLETLLPNRFRDYNVAQAIGENGGPGVEILDKRIAGTPLTSEEESVWATGQRAFSLTSWPGNLSNLQMGMLRFRPEERIAFDRNVKELIEEATGVPVELQERAQQVGQRLGEWLPIRPEVRDLVIEMEGFTQWRGLTSHLRESEAGRNMALQRLFWTEIDRESESVASQRELLDRQWLSGAINHRRYESEQRILQSRIPQLIEDKRKDPRFQMELDGQTFPVPLTMKERQEFANLHNFDPVIMGAEDEFAAMYFQIELEDRFDPETGGIVTDWDRFHLQRKIIREAIVGERAPLFRDRIHRTDTTLDKISRQDYEIFIRPYQKTFDLVLGTFSDEEQSIIKRANFTDDVDEREDLLSRERPDGTNIVSAFRTELTNFRSRLRQLDPELDARLVLWKGLSPKTDRAREIWRDLRARYGFRTDLTVEQVNEGG